ncbi:MAG TPA: MFS transporter, partial [Bryobacteraceae bacterium]|nr:MFS transporter [Bryobacteraceae bacterium]
STPPACCLYNGSLVVRVFKAFEHRDFRLMWAGACTSSIGTWMQKLAQSWLVFELSKSPFLLGLDAFLGEIPILLFSLLGGAVADRRDRRHILLVSQVVQMSCAFFLAFLIATGAVQVWHILGLSFVVGLAQAFGGPAYQALIPSLVRGEDLANAIALNSIQFNLARVIGPVLGGLALANLGAAWCFALNGVSFVAVMVTLLLLKVRYVPGYTTETLVDSMKEGLKFVRSHEAMPALIVLALVMTMLGVPLGVFLPVFAANVFHQGANTYTLLLSTLGCGSIAGALAVAGLSHRVPRGRAALLALVALGAAMAGFSLSKALPLSLVLLFLSGAFTVACFSLVSSLVQETTSDAMRGRVMSVYNVAFRGGMPIGSLITGALIPRMTAPLALAVNGVLLSILGILYLTKQRGVVRLGFQTTAARIVEER